MTGSIEVNVDRMNGIMDTIRHSPSSVREISTFTNIPSQVVQEYVDKLLTENRVSVSHTRKLKMSTVVYYQLTDRIHKY